jgi:predicted ATPase/class 3 adenylate cyclase
MAAQLPTGTVTFLFTDIEDSAGLAQDYPQALPALLAQHHALVRQAIEAQGGVVFRVLGDAFCAAFQTASAALIATLEAQRALQHAAWSPAAVRVRMGVHTGSAQATDARPDDPYSGYLTLTRAQRVMAAAHGQQVLLSGTTATLVSDDLPEGASLRDLGEHRLKGLVQTEHLWQLTAPGLRADFQPLASLKSIPHNLPVPVTSFIGRETELAEGKRLLASTRLLTLTGPGGTGKTRLALQLAADVLDTFPDGVWIVELAALADPALVPQTVAAVWALREQPGRPLSATLQDYVQPKALLLILDNCEHLLEACAQLASALLRGCPRLTILTSSREALGVAGETSYRVPSLALPEAHASLPVERIADYEAVRLFVARAQAVRPDLALTASTLGSIAQICRRLDGIPLALELAAARTKVLSVEQLAARIDDRFRLLTGGSRTALPRQQTLRALIDWSYDLLTPAECAALSRLSVFAGGWTLEAGEALLGPDALDLIGHLVDKSLVVVEDSTKSGAAHYRLLETIRQYARDKLLETGQSAAVRDQHLAYFSRLADEAVARLDGPAMLETLDQLDAELDNLRAALSWALEREPAVALRVAAGLTSFWQRRGHVPEGRRWLRESWAACDAQPTAPGLALQAKGYWASGTLAWAHGEHPEARSALEKSVAAARAANTPTILVDALGNLAFAAIWQDDAAAVTAIIDEGLRVAQLINYRWGLALLHGAQSQAAHRLYGDFALAQSHAESAVRLLRELGGRSPWLAAIFMMELGRVAAEQGRYAEAAAHWTESEALFRQMGDRVMVQANLSEQAHMARRQGKFEQAWARYAQSLLGWQELGHLAAAAHDLECCAFMATTQGNGEQAARLFGAAEHLRASANAPMSSTERDEYQQHQAALRTLLEPAALTAAWMQGQALTLDAAIAYAREAALLHQAGRAAC